VLFLSFFDNGICVNRHVDFVEVFGVVILIVLAIFVVFLVLSALADALV